MNSARMVQCALETNGTSMTTSACGRRSMVRRCVRASWRGVRELAGRAWYVRPTTKGRVQISRTSRGTAPSASQIVRVPHGAAVGELLIRDARTAAVAADGRVHAACA